MERWKAELLQLAFTIVHRNARMLVECDAFTRYNKAWTERREIVTPDTPVVAMTHIRSMSNTPVRFTGPTDYNVMESRAPMAELYDSNRQVLVINGIGCPVAEALSNSNLNSFHLTELEIGLEPTPAVNGIATELEHAWHTKPLAEFSDK